VLRGVSAEEGIPGVVMPSFAQGFSDTDIARIAAYLRRTRTNLPPGPTSTRRSPRYAGRSAPRTKDRRSEPLNMITFHINGRAVTIDVEDDTPLLWVIRDVIGLTGTKFGCGIGMCGACTVHVGGRPTRSCITPVGYVADAEITTIEGLDPQGQHPLQRAWIDLQVPQCGYCQSGQIMQAASLLMDFPTPSDQDIDAVMAGNLCRCMTYIRIRKAIKQAAVELRRAAANG
jgi:isoquinoline 1-oxidoreductase alpha subunit